MPDRPDFKPGQIVERRERFRVVPPGDRYRKDRARLRPIGAEWVVVGARWRVRRNVWAVEVFGVAPYWVALGGHIDADGLAEWATFRTHADAIAYADRRARQENP